MQSPWFSNTMPPMLAVIRTFYVEVREVLRWIYAILLVLCVATVLLILFISGLIRMRLKCRSASICRPASAHYVTASLWCTMWKEKAYLVLMIWMAQIVGSVRPAVAFSLWRYTKAQDYYRPQHGAHSIPVSIELVSHATQDLFNFKRLPVAWSVSGNSNSLLMQSQLTLVSRLSSLFAVSSMSLVVSEDP